MFHYSACRGQNRSLVFVEELVKLFCSNYRQNPQITAAVHYFQKQPPEVFCKKMCSLKVCKYHRKIPVLGPVFKSCRTWSLKFFTKKLQHRCFPVKFAKLLRIPILNSICERLLPCLHYNSIIIFTFITSTIIRSRRLQMFYTMGVLKNFANFTGKHLRWSLFLIKLQT